MATVIPGSSLAVAQCGSSVFVTLNGAKAVLASSLFCFGSTSAQVASAFDAMDG